MIWNVHEAPNLPTAKQMRPSPPIRTPTATVQPVDIVRIEKGELVRGRDLAAREEPLEIRFGGSSFVVIMRTPGSDQELVAGFLLSERIVRTGADIASIRRCTDAEARDPANVMNVWLNGEAAVRAAEALSRRRPVTANSSCGVCGRRSIDDLMGSLGRTESSWTISPETIAAMPDRLRTAQAVFEETGGLHAAGLFDRGGALVGIAEDVGRHNAVDKVIGQELLRGHLPLSDMVLFVSGRTSFEIVQKAASAGVPIVAAVSAPSSLAIALASDANITLLGFVRGETLNVYSGAERLSVR